MSHEDAPEGAPPGVTAQARQGGTVARSRDEQRHGRNVELRKRYIATAEALANTEDPKEQERLKDQLGRIGDEFVEANSGLVGRMVRTFNPHQGNAEDYRGYAAQGLWEAFTRWDPDRSSFSTFSRPFLSGRLQRAVRRWEHSHLTQQEWADRARASKARNQLAVELGRDPTSAEIAARTGYEEASVERMFNSPVRSIEDRADISEDRDSKLSDELLPDIADLIGEDEDIEILLSGLNGLELMAAMFSNDSLSIVPRKLAHVAQSTGLGRNQLGRAAVSGTARLTREVMRKRLGYDAAADAVAREMGIEGRENTVAEALRRANEPNELRAARSRALRHLARSGRNGASGALLRAAEEHLKASEQRIYDLIAEVVNEIANSHEQHGPHGWVPADPESVADAAWVVFCDPERWSESGSRAAFVRSVRRAIAADMREMQQPIDSSDHVEVDGDWVKRRVRR